MAWRKRKKAHQAFQCTAHGTNVPFSSSKHKLFLFSFLNMLVWDKKTIEQWKFSTPWKSPIYQFFKATPQIPKMILQCNKLWFLVWGDFFEITLEFYKFFPPNTTIYNLMIVVWNLFQAYWGYECGVFFNLLSSLTISSI